MEKYNMHPFTLVELGEEIKKVCNDYRGNSISYSDVKSLMKHYATSQNNFFDLDGQINKTIRKVIGKKRVEFIDSLLTEFQRKIV